MGRIQGMYPVKETVFVLDFKRNRNPSSPGGGGDGGGGCWETVTLAIYLPDL